jgi:RNA polymerase sigma factor (TIGR02999 family)
MAESPLDALVPQRYDELRAIAARAMRGERPDHTLQPTAVVNEAYLRLAASSGLDLSERPRVLALAAKAIRHVLVDHARRKRAQKRPGAALRVTLSDSSAVAEPTRDWLVLDQALGRLEATDERAARIFELRALGGLEVEEVAALVELSPATVKRDFAVARAFLHRELSGGAAADARA